MIRHDFATIDTYRSRRREPDRCFRQVGSVRQVDGGKGSLTDPGDDTFTMSVHAGTLPVQAGDVLFVSQQSPVAL